MKGIQARHYEALVLFSFFTFITWGVKRDTENMSPAFWNFKEVLRGYPERGTVSESLLMRIPDPEKP